MTTPAPTPAPSSIELRDLAVVLARKAGELVTAMRSDIQADSIATKSSTVDLVTAADQAAEKLIVDGILAARPDDGILGEEGASIDSSNGVRWIIDPIDGTTNFVYQIPAFSVSIAVEIDGVVSAGAVYQPSTGVMYEAALGAGARRDDQPISVNPKTSLETSLVATGFGYGSKRREGQAQVLLSLLPVVRDIRRFGSAALDLCFLAEGKVDAYYERGLNDWDMAAGALIAAEAGAIVGDLRGNGPTTDFLVAAPAGIFSGLRDLLKDAGADSKP